MSRTLTPALVLTTAAGLAAWMVSASAAPPAQNPANPGALFATADACLSCHTGMIAADGEDVSFGPQWRASMMANAARDPYWQAGVRREVTEHPRAAALIEDECSACHMPMARYSSRVEGHEGAVFAHLPVGLSATPGAPFAADGVSCTACHQIAPDRLGERASFTGAFEIDRTTPAGRRRVFGPFDTDPGRTRIMQSATGFVPGKGTHQSASEICASCHTLITQAFGPDGSVVGELPEQVPYLEWQHSRYRETRSCQSCHMPVVESPVAVTPVWSQPREEVSRHSFRGGNGFMIRLLTRHAAELGVAALPAELQAAVTRTEAHLSSDTARVRVQLAEVTGLRLRAQIAVENLAGHKLPTAYPSRRAWLHVTVRDAGGSVVFESGRPDPSGRIAGNDNDEQASRFEPHHAEISAPDQVQIYESVMADTTGAVTTGLLSAVRYVKDNRLLPEGFEKGAAPADVAVHGAAIGDADFVAGRDVVGYAVTVPAAGAPFRVEAELLYQSIGFRWADNLRRFDTPETKRFVGYYEAMASAATVVLARDVATAR